MVGKSRKTRHFSPASLVLKVLDIPITFSFFIMELLNVSFAILLVKMAICILPGVLGIFFIVSSEETKRHMRSTLCNQLFGVSNAIPFPKFERFLYVSGTVLVLLSLIATWFIHLRKFF